MIAQDFLGEQRSDVQCLHRWQKVLQPGLVKGPWTKEEDQIIIDCIDAGITKWRCDYTCDKALERMAIATTTSKLN